MRGRALRWGLGILCALCLSRCLMEGSGDFRGDYAFLPGSQQIDTEIYPLRHLLILEDDRGDGTTVVYYFTGDLSAADLGFGDLRRLWNGFGGYQMAFDPPRSEFVRGIREAWPPAADDAGVMEPGQADVSAKASGQRPLRLRADGEDVGTLFPLAGEQLSTTGAARWLRTLGGTGFTVQAYVGLLPSLPSNATLSVAGTPVVHMPALVDAKPSLIPSPTSSAETPQATLQTQDLAAADYLVVELWQPITMKGDGTDSAGMADADVGDAGTGDAGSPDGMEGGPRAQEAMMRTELLPQWTYAVSQSLLSGAVERGCWSVEAPLHLRVIQIKRAYQASQDGDFAVLHHRIDDAVVQAETWQGLLRPDLRYVPYCESYLP